VNRRPPFGRPYDWEDSEAGGVGPLPEPHEIEGYAAEFGALLGLEYLWIVPAVRALSKLIQCGLVTLSRATPGKCLGWTHGNTISIRPGLEGRRLEETVRDELSHWFFQRKNLYPSDHDSIHEAFCLCWQAPAEHIRRMRNAATGFAYAVRAFVRLYSPLYPRLSEVLARCAAACDVAVVIHDDYEGRVIVGQGPSETNLLLTAEQERELCRRATLSGEREVGKGGVHAVSYCYQGHRGVVLCLDRSLPPHEPSTDYDGLLRDAWLNDREG
jgi:hypothetical protein